MLMNECARKKHHAHLLVYGGRAPLLSFPFILLGLERKNLCLVSLVLVVVGFVVVDSVLALANRRITSGPSGSFDTNEKR